MLLTSKVCNISKLLRSSCDYCTIGVPCLNEERQEEVSCKWIGWLKSVCAKAKGRGGIHLGKEDRGLLKCLLESEVLVKREYELL